MKILSGNEQRDSGAIYINRQEIDIRTPRDARKYGIAIIHQELNTVPDMTVAENLFLGRNRPLSPVFSIANGCSGRPGRSWTGLTRTSTRSAARFVEHRTSANGRESPAPSVKTQKYWCLMSRPPPCRGRRPSTYRLIEQMHQDDPDGLHLAPHGRKYGSWQTGTVFRTARGSARKP